MRILRNLLVGIVALVLLVLAAAGVAWLRTAPEALPDDSESALRLMPGPYTVGEAEFTWVDDSRPTPPNGNYPGAPERSLPTTMWYPKDADGKHPFVVYCHGFVSARSGGAYLAKHLASYGYVVVSADFPLTNAGAPGGPNLGDAVHQPADVSFLIDRSLALASPEKPFAGEIDRDRIGVFGLSLGAITATLASFHPEWRDPRVAVVIAIAGVGDVFGPDFFAHARIPFLMLAGTADDMVDYEANAVPVPDRIHDGGLVTIAGATHVGFDDLAGGVMRLFGNPDKVGCFLGGAQPDPGEKENPFSGMFGTEAQGLLTVPEYPMPCRKSFDHPMLAGRQHMLTTVIVRAFFDSHFTLDGRERSASEQFLTRTLPSELPEVTFMPARG